MKKFFIRSLFFSFLLLGSLALSSSPVNAQQGCFKRESLRLNTLTPEASPRAGQRFLIEVKGLVDDASVKYAIRYFNADRERPPVITSENERTIFYPDKFPNWELDLKGGLAAGRYTFELLRAGRIGLGPIGVRGNFEDICTTLRIAVNNADGSGPASVSQGGGFGGINRCKDGTEGVDTGLGCLPSDPGKLASALFSVALGIAGAIAVLMIIIGGFKVATSQGNVDALQDGKDTITKAITGLAFILLATTILGIIGIDILGIKFFSRDGAGIIINQK